MKLKKIFRMDYFQTWDKKKNFLLLFFLGIFFSAGAQNFLTCKGNKLVDACNNPVRLTGVNWFGFETSNKVFHGLWSRDYKSMLQQIKALGFNCIRVPWCNEILKPGTMPSGITFSGADPYNGQNPMNGDLNGLTSIQVLDKVVAYCKTLGLKIILDHHSIQPDGYTNEPLWYTSSFTEQQWIDDWVTMATRYNNNDVVIGFDLDNEPHAQATWGNTSASTDWNKAAERCANQILSANANALIIIEGVETYGGNGYWWGGNLRGVNSFPITINKPEKLVYSVHEYGPEIFNQTWFNDGSFPANMPTVWNNTFGYIRNNNTGHLYVGEFGLKDTASVSGKSGKWFDAFLKYMSTDYSWTYWCINPNSGDTGGILADDWKTVNSWKVNRLKPFMAPLISSCSVTTAGEDTERKNNIIVYPNPAKEMVTIDLSNVENYSSSELSIQDIQGRTILTMKANENPSVQINTNGILTAGIYFIALKNDKIALVKKLLVE